MATLESIKGVGKLSYNTEECEVLEVRLLSETYVRGSGGGGSSDAYGNVTVDPVRIGSTVRNVANAVVRYPDGQEGSVEVEADFTLRQGHRLLMIRIPSESDKRCSYIYNRNTGLFWIDPSMRPQRKGGIVAIPIMLGFLGSFLTLMQATQVTYSGNPSNNNPIFWLGIILCPIIGIVVAVRKVNKQRRRIARTRAINEAFLKLAPSLRGGVMPGRSSLPSFE